VRVIEAWEDAGFAKISGTTSVNGAVAPRKKHRQAETRRGFLSRVGVPIEKRVIIARGFLQSLAVTTDDLRVP